MFTRPENRRTRIAPTLNDCISGKHERDARTKMNRNDHDSEPESPAGSASEITNHALPEQPTSTLLRLVLDQQSGRDQIYEATQTVLKRWRQGIDLVPLIDLLLSESSRDRVFGAYLLTELGEEVEGLNAAATRLADDDVSRCRKAFVDYFAWSRRMNERVSSGLAKCLQDSDLRVRVATIKWATQTSEARFEHFCRLIEAGAGRPEIRFRDRFSNEFWHEAVENRALRGLEVIRRLRAGEKVRDIRKNTPGEDSLVFDSIEFSETTDERISRRRARGRTGFQSNG